MKIQIDTVEKIIKIEEKVNIGEFIQKLEDLLPNSQWQSYSLEVAVITNWTHPIIIDYPIPWTYPYRPFWEQPFVTYDTSTTVYNVEIN